MMEKFQRENPCLKDHKAYRRKGKMNTPTTVAIMTEDQEIQVTEIRHK